MSSVLLPGPADAEPEKIGYEQSKVDNHNTGADRRRQQQRQRARKPDIPSEEDCLGAIAQVARLVVMGLLETAQANAIRAAFREILLYHRNKSKVAEKGISNVELLDVLRKDPRLLSLFEPLLSQEQIELILRAGDSDGENAA